MLRAMVHVACRNLRAICSTPACIGSNPKQTAPSVPLADKANAALNRIEIPQDTIERISELLTPASSLIISDNGFSQETGKDTDFIVVTH